MKISIVTKIMTLAVFLALTLPVAARAEVVTCDGSSLEISSGQGGSSMFLRCGGFSISVSGADKSEWRNLVLIAKVKGLPISFDVIGRDLGSIKLGVKSESAKAE